MGSLNGKIAWVTDAGGGIGEASAKALASSGAHVVLSSRRLEELERWKDEIVAVGARPRLRNSMLSMQSHAGDRR